MSTEALRRRARVGVCGLVGLQTALLCAVGRPADIDAAALAKQVTIHRDGFGVPHVIGDNDESTIFGFGYAQAEDNFWQVEDSYILALGRYCEVHGPQGINSDLLNRAFEIVPRSRRDFPALDKTSRELCGAFVAGINYYLETHPHAQPRLIEKFQPWHVLAFHRHAALELGFRLTGLSDEYLPRRNPHMWTAVGSNGWAISGSRTASGHPMLLAAPHMPWYGFAQLAEAHLKSGGSGSADGEADGWNFIGAHFYGSPVLALGHNERLAWTLVSNQPDVADVWHVDFSHPDDELAYRYNNGWRKAEQWTESIRVRKARSMEEREFTFRKTHHGPIVAKDDEERLLAARISGLFESVPLRQSLQMMRARNRGEFRAALSAMQIIYMNVLYADCDGQIEFIYMGNVPRRNPQLDWSQPVDGSDPAAQWLGVHTLDELPSVLNPAAGFLQNCNSSPLHVTDGGNPSLDDYPPYMIQDADVLNRRALRSLELLRDMKDIAFDQWQEAAFDTQVYWARHELPKYAVELEKLKQDDPSAATRVRPYLEHLLAWDSRITADSTAASLCHAWYEQLYGRGYPGEQLKEHFRDKPDQQLAALAEAAERLEIMHGSWKIPYGELYRIQRQAEVSDVIDLRFDDRGDSLPTLGGHGPMGVAWTMYFTPSIDIPPVISQRRRYGVVGTSYLAALEMSPGGVRGASLVPFGTSGDERSAHYFDQGQLLSERRMKPERFTRAAVLKAATRSYHPGARRSGEAQASQR